MTGQIVYLAAQAKHHPHHAAPPFEAESKKREVGNGYWPLNRFQLRRPPRPAIA